MASDQVKLPGIDTHNWKAIDIFVFSNGQQYSPPRKYHLRAEDLNWWKSTLNFLARTQYGTVHSYVDLYTTDGKKIVSPLELSNGAPYVAVAPHDRFLEAGYEKYLIRASRSWEKRQLRKSSMVEPDKSMKQTEIVHHSVKVNEPDNTRNLQEESMDLKTIVPSMVDHENSVIVQPKSQTTPKENLEPAHATPAKLTERKRPSIQRPIITRKNTPPVSPVPNMKTPFKKKDSLTPNNLPSIKSENRRNSLSASGTNQIAKMAAKSKIYKPTIKPKESSILPKTHEDDANGPHEIKSSSLVKINTKNETTNIDGSVKNLLEDKELVMISNIYQNPGRDMPSVAVDPKLIQHIGPIGNHIVLATPMENIQAVKLYRDPKKSDNINEPVNVNISHVIKKQNSLPRNQLTKSNKILDNKTNDIGHKIKEHTNSNENKSSTAIDKENKTKYISPAKLSILKLSDVSQSLEIESPKLKENININSNLNMFPYNSTASKHLSVGTTVSDTQDAYHTINHNTEKSENVNVSNNAPENMKAQNLNSKINENSSDGKYVATLNKGEFVNLNLNVEIHNYDGGLVKITDNASLQPVTNIQRTEKGSQINVAHPALARNKSMLSLIAKEISERHIGDNLIFIIAQCSHCKYCNNENVSMQDKNENKNYIILLPVKRCNCAQSHDEVQCSSLINSVKATISCTSLQRLTKLTQMENPVDTSSHPVATSDPIPKENVLLETRISDKDVMTVSRKKSVTIQQGSMPISRECSKISYYNNTKAEYATVSKESTEVTHKPTVDNFTQTEWCDVLLEVRLLEDRHYTFRFPTLEILKNYRLV